MDRSSEVCSSNLIVVLCLLGGYRARGTRGYGRNVGSHRDQTLRGTSPMTLKQRERIRKAWRDYRQERHVFQYLTERGPARIPALPRRRVYRRREDWDAASSCPK